MSFGDLRKIKAARVEKECAWCWTKCEVGQPRVGFFGEWDGEMQDWVMHPECYDAYQREDDGGDGQIHGEKHERGLTCGETMDKANVQPQEPRKEAQ